MYSNKVVTKGLCGKNNNSCYLISLLCFSLSNKTYWLFIFRFQTRISATCATIITYQNCSPTNFRIDQRVTSQKVSSICSNLLTQSINRSILRVLHRYQNISKHNTFNWFIAPPRRAFCFFCFAPEPKPYLGRWDEAVPQKLSTSGSTIYFDSLTRTTEKNRYRHTNEKILPIYICLDTCMKYIYMDVFPQFTICIEVDWNRLRHAISSPNFLDIIDFLTTIC